MSQSEAAFLMTEFRDRMAENYSTIILTEMARSGKTPRADFLATVARDAFTFADAMMDARRRGSL